MSRSDFTRYAKAAVAVKELYPKMMRKLAEVHISAPMLHTMIEKDTHGINEILHEDEKRLVDTLRSGYNMFDETLMYKIISFFDIVRKPSNNWGKSPTNRHQMTLGDDIERLRKRRNTLVHLPEPQLSESQFEEFFNELYEIAQRFDIHLHQSTSANRFQDEVINMKRQSPDPETQAKYKGALEKVIEKKKEIEHYVDNHFLQVFLGRDIKELMKEARKATGEELDDTVWINMFLFRVKDKKKAVRNLQKAIDELVQYGDMVITDVEESSILLHLRVKKSCFKEADNLTREVVHILELLLPYTKKYLEYNIQVVMSVNTVKDDLFGDSRKWRRVRNETLPRLRRVEKRLNEAGQNVRNFRLSRNLATGAVLFGILMAPLTGGISLGWTVGALTVGVGGVTLGTIIIEQFLAGGVLDAAQASINKDKKETNYLRHRVHFYMERGGTYQEKQFASQLHESFPNAIINVVDQSFQDFIISFINTEAGSVFRARDKVSELRKDLETELQRVADMERVHVYY